MTAIQWLGPTIEELRDKRQMTLAQACVLFDTAAQNVVVQASASAHSKFMYDQHLTAASVLADEEQIESHAAKDASAAADLLESITDERSIRLKLGRYATRGAAWIGLKREQLRRDGRHLPRHPTPQLAAVLVREALYSLYADAEALDGIAAWPTEIDAVQRWLVIEWNMRPIAAEEYETVGSFWPYSGIEASLVNDPAGATRAWRPSLSATAVGIEAAKRDVLAAIARALSASDEKEGS